MEQSKFNVWAMLVVVFVLGYGFAALNTKFLIPAAAAQIAANQGLVNQVNQVLKTQNEQRDKWQTKVDTRLDLLEKQR